MGTDTLGQRLTSAFAKVKAYHELGVSALLTPEEVSVLLGISSKTLANWRWRRQGPPYIKLTPRKVRYPVKSLLSWLEENQKYGGRLYDALSDEQARFD